MMTMMLCSGLEPAEQDKVERLDGPIAGLFIGTGVAVRLCQGRGVGNDRFLEFQGPAGTVASVPADQFMAASDDAAVALVADSL